MSKRKPLNDTAGYVASLKTTFGYVMITDRDNGGDWIDSEERWVVSAFDNQLANLALIESSSLRRAREIMKDARRDGFATDWIDFSEAA
jgi:hypothetical protein